MIHPISVLLLFKSYLVSITNYMDEIAYLVTSNVNIDTCQRRFAYFTRKTSSNIRKEPIEKRSGSQPPAAISNTEILCRANKIFICYIQSIT